MARSRNTSRSPLTWYDFILKSLAISILVWRCNKTITWNMKNTWRQMLVSKIAFRRQVWWMVTHRWQTLKTTMPSQAPPMEEQGPVPSSKQRPARRPPLQTERSRQNTTRAKSMQRRKNRPSLSWGGCSFKAIREWRLWLRSSNTSFLRYFGSIKWTDFAVCTFAQP